MRLRINGEVYVGGGRRLVKAIADNPYKPPSPKLPNPPLPQPDDDPNKPMTDEVIEEILEILLRMDRAGVQNHLRQLKQHR
jgi:hypothetical protein